MTVTYNALNQPATVTMSTGDMIQYMYTADGTKIQEVLTTSGGTVTTKDYIDEAVYINTTLSYVADEEGRVTYNSTANTTQMEYPFSSVRVPTHRNSDTVFTAKKSIFIKWKSNQPSYAIRTWNMDRYIFGQPRLIAGRNL
jgi:YD repeat-containing protein